MLYVYIIYEYYIYISYMYKCIYTYRYIHVYIYMCRYIYTRIHTFTFPRMRITHNSIHMYILYIWCIYICINITLIHISCARTLCIYTIYTIHTCVYYNVCTYHVHTCDVLIRIKYVYTYHVPEYRYTCTHNISTYATSRPHVITY